MNTRKTLTALLLVLGMWTTLSSLVSSPELEAASFDAKKVIPGWDLGEVGAEQKILGKNGAGDKASLVDPSKSSQTKSLLLLIPKITEILTIIIAPLMVAMIVWSGLQFIIANGDEESISKSKRFFSYSVMGFIFVVIAYTVVRIGSNLLLAS